MRIIRSALAAALALGLLGTPVVASAQPQGKVYRIGILGDKAADANEMFVWQTFCDSLRDHGWKEGVNIRIESQWVEGNVARRPEMAADLVRLKPDLIATRGSIFTGALKAATSSIPIVFLAHADPVETGRLISYYHSGEETWRRATVYVDKILRGAKPADLPVEQVAKFELVINNENREGARSDDPAFAPAASG